MGRKNRKNPTENMVGPPESLATIWDTDAVNPAKLKVVSDKAVLVFKDGRRKVVELDRRVDIDDPPETIRVVYLTRPLGPGRCKLFEASGETISTYHEQDPEK